MNSQRKSAPLGDLQLREKKDDQGQFVSDLFEVRDQNGNPTGEYLEQYQIKVYIPDDVDEAGIGEPSVVLKKDQFINARALSAAEKDRLPDFLFEGGNKSQRCKVACKLNVQMDRKQYPRNK